MLLTFVGVCRPKGCFFIVFELAHPGQVNVEVFH